MASKTRGQHEAEMTRAIILFEKEHLGRGPTDARTYFVHDMILIRLTGVLTPAEIKVAENEEGRLLVKRTRRMLFETSRPELEALVEQVLGSRVISLHTDMSTVTGERVIVMTVDEDLDERFA